MLKLYKLLSDGRCQITGFLFAGDFLGFAGANTQGYTAEAVVPTTVCCFSRSRFMRVLDEFPALERTLLDRATSDLQAAQEQMLLLGRKSARERVASFLVLMCRRQGLRQDDSAPADEPRRHCGSSRAYPGDRQPDVEPAPGRTNPRSVRDTRGRDRRLAASRAGCRGLTARSARLALMGLALGSCTTSRPPVESPQQRPPPVCPARSGEADPC